MEIIIIKIDINVYECIIYNVYIFIKNKHFQILFMLIISKVNNFTHLIYYKLYYSNVYGSGH